VDWRTRNLFVAAVAVTIAAAVGAAVILGAIGSSGTNQPSDAQSVIGVIVGVDSAGLDKVHRDGPAGQGLVPDRERCPSRDPARGCGLTLSRRP